MSALTALTIGIHPQEFIDACLQKGIKRGYFITQNGSLLCSHPELEEIAQFIRQSSDYQQHEGLFFEANESSNALFIAGVHNTTRGAGQGGTRFKQYQSVKEIFTDVMRLAEGMTYKNACANIWWGGGKGVVFTSNAPITASNQDRVNIFAQYGRFVASLNGCYITAEDMNTTPEDMRVIHSNNRFCTCVPQEIGGSANPSQFTARGVFQGMLAGVRKVWGTEATIKGKKVLVQGAGSVGGHLIDEIIANGGLVTLFEPNATTIEKLKSKYNSNILEVESDYNRFLSTEADVFSPNAIGGILNDESIPLLKVKLVSGGANNQLLLPLKHASMLLERGIGYTPDFIVNCMGIINCANEQYGYLLSDIEKQILQI